MINKLSPAIFGIALICFLLPWITVSCGSQKVMSFSGTDLAIGKTIEVPQGFVPPKKENTREVKATIAFLAAIAGIAISFLIKADRAQKVASAVCGGGGGVLLYLLKSKLDSELVAKGSGMITVDYHFGFWVSMLILLGAGILNILSLAGVLEKVTDTSTSGLSLRSPAKPSFCSQCGAKVELGATFCSECGKAVK